MSRADHPPSQWRNPAGQSSHQKLGVAPFAIPKARSLRTPSRRNAAYPLTDRSLNIQIKGWHRTLSLQPHPLQRRSVRVRPTLKVTGLQGQEVAHSCASTRIACPSNRKPEMNQSPIPFSALPLDRDPSIEARIIHEDAPQHARCTPWTSSDGRKTATRLRM